jgi:hypothetical protein
MDVRGHIEFGKYNEGRSLYTKSGSSEEYSVVKYMPIIIHYRLVE